MLYYSNQNINFYIENVIIDWIFFYNLLYRKKCYTQNNLLCNVSLYFFIMDWIMSYILYYMLYRYHILYKYKQNKYLLLLLNCKSQVKCHACTLNAGMNDCLWSRWQVNPQILGMATNCLQIVYHRSEKSSLASTFLQQ